jgi:hypothetical protein
MKKNELNARLLIVGCVMFFTTILLPDIFAAQQPNENPLRYPSRQFIRFRHRRRKSRCHCSHVSRDYRNVSRCDNALSVPAQQQINLKYLIYQSIKDEAIKNDSFLLKLNSFKWLRFLKQMLRIK